MSALGAGGAPAVGRLPRVSRLDVALGAFLTVFGTLGSTHNHRVGLLAALTAAAFALPLPARRSAPLATLVAFSVGIGVNAVFAHRGVRCGAAIPVVLLLLFSSGTRLDGRRTLIALIVGLAGIAVEDLTDPRLDAGTLIALLPLCAAAWLAGRTVGSRDAAALELQERTRLLELRREETAQLALEVERLRIAADLDSVAHRRVGDIVELARSGEAVLDRGTGAQGIHSAGSSAEAVRRSIRFVACSVSCAVTGRRRSASHNRAWMSSTFF